MFPTENRKLKIWEKLLKKEKRKKKQFGNREIYILFGY